MCDPFSVNPPGNFPRELTLYGRSCESPLRPMRESPGPSQLSPQLAPAWTNDTNDTNETNETPVIGEGDNNGNEDGDRLVL